MIALVTTAAGRHDHLRLQLRALRSVRRRPDLHVVVAMDDPCIAEICSTAAIVIDRPRVKGRLPVAAARNLGARCALDAGADVLVFLDVDCVPSSRIFEQYAAASDQASGALLSGPVAYLPPPPSGGYCLDTLAGLADPHPHRPAPEEGDLEAADHTLFWSLSFALRAPLWSEMGGFCEDYSGYGAEDTDFGQLARARGLPHLVVGGATAYHQWHPAPDPPLQHVADIVRNGRIFRERWGWWPMTGWLTAFRDLGFVAYNPQTDDWTVHDLRSRAGHDDHLQR